MSSKNEEYQFEDVFEETEKKAFDEEYVSIIKCGFAFPYGDIYGLIEIIFDEANFQTDFISTVVDFNSKLFSISPNEKWRDFEKKLLDLANENKRNERLSNKLQKKIDRHINYNNYQEMAEILKKKNGKRLKDFILNFIVTLYGYPECKILVSQERIPSHEYDEIRNEDGSSYDDEYDETEEVAYDGEGQPSAELVISPIFGVPVYRLVVGDVVYLLPHEVFDGENETPDRMKGVIDSISYAESGARIVVKSEDEMLFKVFEYENIKVKCLPKNRSHFMFNMFRNHFDWFLIIFFVFFAFFLFGILGI